MDLEANDLDAVLEDALEAVMEKGDATPWKPVEAEAGALKAVTEEAAPWKPVEAEAGDLEAVTEEAAALKAER